MKKGSKHKPEACRKISKGLMGNTNSKGNIASPSTCRKISGALVGRTLSETHKRRISEARKGKVPTEDTKRKMAEARIGRTLSETHKRRISEAGKGRVPTDATRQKLSEWQKGKTFSDQHRQHLSAAQQHIIYDEWEAYACEKKYCPKFNEACRESNREKYGRKCFMCGKSEKANGQRLSVHHVDMQKSQGCESNWKLVPLCRHCHATAHNDEMIARLGYILRR